MKNIIVVFVILFTVIAILFPLINEKTVSVCTAAEQRAVVLMSKKISTPPNSNSRALGSLLGELAKISGGVLINATIKEKSPTHLLF
jgi:hypothetical protein